MSVDLRAGYLVVYCNKGLDNKYTVTDVLGITDLTPYTASGVVRDGSTTHAVTVTKVGATLECTIPASVSAVLSPLSAHYITITKDGVAQDVVSGPVINTLRGSA